MIQPCRTVPIQVAATAQITYREAGLVRVSVLDGSGREIIRREGPRENLQRWLARRYPDILTRLGELSNPGKETPGVTDRALRYRANASPPPGPRRCCLCGSVRNVEVGHVNGREEDNAPENLFFTCRACNVRCGNTLRKAGLGRPTRQFNPGTGGAQSLSQWMNAVMSMKGEGGTMSVADAVAVIRATPSEQRSKFAREIWAIRRRRGTSKRVPF